MSIADLIQAMNDAGAPTQAIILAVRAIEAAESKVAATREKNRERKQRQREKSRDSHATVTGPLPEEKGFPTPLLKTQPIPSPPSPPKGGSSPKAFEEFWLAYPKKVGKGAARNAFSRSLAKIGGAEPLAALMAALTRIKPAWTDPQFIPHPATWLNQERWADGETVQPELRIPKTPAEQAAYDAKWAAYLERLEKQEQADA